MKQKNIFFILILFAIFFSTSLQAKKTSNYFIEKAQKELPPQCIFFFKMYLNAKDSKAFAYTIDNNSKYTCRFSSSSKNEKKAKEIALASCEKSRIKREIKNSCKLYDVDLKGFKTQAGLNFTKKYKETLKKIKKELRDNNKTKKITKKVEIKKQKNKKIKKDINLLPKPCHMFYALYKKSPPSKAFAIAIDSDTKYVCKFSANSTNTKKAKEVALASCEKSKKQRGVKSSCTIFDLDIVAKKIKPIRDPKLEKAILEANLNTIKKLIRAGANVNTEASDHSRALFVAAAKGDIKFVKELFKKGANPYFRKSDGNNLLVAAIMSGKVEILKIMLSHKISPNKKCNDGNTPLHFAFMMFDDKMMRELYKYGARDDIKNNKGQSVKDMAKEYHVNLNKLKR